MITLYYSGTPNGQKILLFLYETALPYRLVPVSLSKGEQHKAEFLKISPNNKIPAIVDEEPADGGAPIPVFESAAILHYLADKTGRFIPADPRARLEVLQWLCWQISGLGMMSGQLGHFTAHAPEKIPYAIARYTREVARLYRVLDRRLAGREFIVGDYSIADMACFPWVVPHTSLGIELGEYPHIARWFKAIRHRPAVVRAYVGITDPYAPENAPMSSEERRNLFAAASPPASI